MSTVNNRLPEELKNGIRMLGDVWTLCIIGTLSKGDLRFNELQRAITGINPTTLTNRLKKLEKENMIARREATVDKLSVIYSLTEKGRGILPILKEIQLFANEFLKT
jgi:DNA-binding HxlR family transcriptional regulator